MKIAIVLGTRPEIIKLSSIIRECQKRELDYFIIHTGQHYSANMDAVFFEELDLPAPKYNLQIEATQHGTMVGRQLEAIEKILIDEKPNWVLVQGDTNTVLAGALAASKLGIKVGHVEAGLRSYDREMPEEINRVLTDHLADKLFAVGEKQRNNLLQEGIDEKRIAVVGNTIVDAIWQNQQLAQEKGTLTAIKEKYQLEKWVLLTCHRPSNADAPENLRSIMAAAETLGRETGRPVIFPIHPRTKKNLVENNLSINEEVVRIIEPVGYLEMLSLISGAELVMTDSGGIQEEACVLGVPSVILRENTERPEVLEVGAGQLVGGNDEQRILTGAREMLRVKKDEEGHEKWTNPFGDGKSGERIIDLITTEVNN